jgi:hypothetical protein
VTHDADRNAIVDVGPSHQRESGEHVRITLPSACGNSPRITIVGELVARWANRDAEAPAVRAAEDVRWTIDGREAGHSPGAVEHAFPDGPVELGPAVLQPRVPLRRSVEDHQDHGGPQLRRRPDRLNRRPDVGPWRQREDTVPSNRLTDDHVARALDTASW